MLKFGRVRDDEFMVGSCSDHDGRILLGSCWNRPCNANDASSVFSRFLFDFGLLFCVGGTVFGEVGG